MRLRDWKGQAELEQTSAQVYGSYVFFLPVGVTAVVEAWGWGLWQEGLRPRHPRQS